MNWAWPLPSKVPDATKRSATDAALVPGSADVLMYASNGTFGSPVTFAWVDSPGMSAGSTTETVMLPSG